MARRIGHVCAVWPRARCGCNEKAGQPAFRQTDRTGETWTARQPGDVNPIFERYGGFYLGVTTIWYAPYGSWLLIGMVTLPLLTLYVCDDTLVAAETLVLRPVLET